MRRTLNLESLRELMQELAHTAPQGESFRIYVVGGGTAVLAGWRPSTIDADLFAESQEVFREIQGIKERLRLNIEFVRPEHFVPPLAGTADRHRFIERVGLVDFYHYDPYAQLLSKVVRGFRKDLSDARDFVESGWVDVGRFRNLVEEIRDAAYAQYPQLDRASILAAVVDFIATLDEPRPEASES